MSNLRIDNGRKKIQQESKTNPFVIFITEEVGRDEKELQCICALFSPLDNGMLNQAVVLTVVLLARKWFHLSL